MNKTIQCFVTALFCLLSVNSKATGQSIEPLTATGEVFAEIIPVFSASQYSQLNFGKFSPGISGGEVIMSPENIISCTGSVYQGQGFHNAASFIVAGDVDAVFSINLPSEGVIITNEGSDKTMIVYNWTSVPPEGPGQGLLQGGEEIILIGATLKVGTLEDNPPGTYSGSYTVTFDFN